MTEVAKHLWGEIKGKHTISEYWDLVTKRSWSDVGVGLLKTVIGIHWLFKIPSVLVSLYNEGIFFLPAGAIDHTEQISSRNNWGETNFEKLNHLSLKPKSGSRGGLGVVSGGNSVLAEWGSKCYFLQILISPNKRPEEKEPERVRFFFFFFFFFFQHLALNNDCYYPTTWGASVIYSFNYLTSI